jgi:hypothetical protein
MERYKWKFNGKHVTCYVVNGIHFTGAACHMRALKEWGKSNPHIQRDTPLGIREVAGKLKVVKKKRKKNTAPPVVSSDLSTAEIAKARKNIKSDFT